MQKNIRMKIKSIRYEMPELLFAQAVSESAQEMPEIKITEDMLSAAEDDAMEINTSGLLSIEDGRVEFSYDESERLLSENEFDLHLALRSQEK